MHSNQLNRLLKRGSLWFAEGLSEQEQKRRLQKIFGQSVSSAVQQKSVQQKSVQQKVRGGSQNSPLTIPFRISAIDSCFPAGGLKVGAVHEWFSVDPAADNLASNNSCQSNFFRNSACHNHSFCGQRYPPATIVSMLAGNAIAAFIGHTGISNRFDKFLLWIGESCWPAPFLLENIFSQYRSEQNLLGRCLFLNPHGKKLLLQTVDAALRSPAVAVVIADLPQLPFPVSRRFALSSAKNSSLGLFLRDPKEISFSSAAETKWKITPHPSDLPLVTWRVSLLKNKGQQSAKDSWLVTLDDSTDQWSLQETAGVLSEQAGACETQQRRA